MGIDLRGARVFRVIYQGDKTRVHDGGGGGGGGKKNISEGRGTGKEGNKNALIPSP